jgi:hypothetical protein
MLSIDVATYAQLACFFWQVGTSNIALLGTTAPAADLCCANGVQCLPFDFQNAQFYVAFFMLYNYFVKKNYI